MPFVKAFVYIFNNRKKKKIYKGQRSKNDNNETFKFEVGGGSQLHGLGHWNEKLKASPINCYN